MGAPLSKNERFKPRHARTKLNQTINSPSLSLTNASKTSKSEYSRFLTNKNHRQRGIWISQSCSLQKNKGNSSFKKDEQVRNASKEPSLAYKD